MTTRPAVIPNRLPVRSSTRLKVMDDRQAVAATDKGSTVLDTTSAGAIKSFKELEKALDARDKQLQALTEELWELRTQLLVLLGEQKDARAEAARKEERYLRMLEEAARSNERNQQLIEELSLTLRTLPVGTSVAASAAADVRHGQGSRHQTADRRQTTATRTAVTADDVVSSVPLEGGDSWAEVVRRKPQRQKQPQQCFGSDNGERYQQQQKQHQQLRRQQQLSLPHQKPREQQHAAQQFPKRTRPNRKDIVEIAPAADRTWTEVYLQLRQAPELDDVKEAIGVGRRTAKQNLRMVVAREADSAAIASRIQAVIGNAGAARVVTQMAEVIVTNVD
uniref:Uncharacterized protein n=1 Tax=Anopheles maculatus TaxID=74869 RepID=A0A182SWG5_9DIPT